MVPPSAYVIKKGVVKTYNLTARGEEKPISFNVKDDSFPLGWVFGKLQKTQYYYEALNDCELYCVPASDYIAFIKDSPSTLFQLLDASVSDHLNFQMRINALGQSNATQKVLHTIHYLALLFGYDLKPDVVEIPLPLTQQDLANFMGLTRETASREIKQLVTQKIITYKNRNYVVHTSKLNDLLDDDYGHYFVRQAIR